MAIEERDPHTGYLTTGHEWNGIKELNTPVPRAVYFFLISTALFALVYWILMPAWPLGTTYTRGLLGIDQRSSVAVSLKQAVRDRQLWATRISSGTYADIQADSNLMETVRQTGRALFGDNCAVCHGSNAKGGPGFPSLTTGSWLWGGAPNSIEETIRVGINSSHSETRSSQMPAFGRDGVLSRKETADVVDYVLRLSASLGSEAGALDTMPGRAIFNANCASCHGNEGRGNVELGSADLTDHAWIYGGDGQSVYNSVWNGRQGHMPTWEARLSALDRKILVLYLLDVRAAQK